MICLPFNGAHRRNWPGSESAVYFCAHGQCHAEEVPQVPEAPAAGVQVCPQLSDSCLSEGWCLWAQPAPRGTAPQTNPAQAALSIPTLASHPLSLELCWSRDQQEQAWQTWLPSLWVKREKMCRKWLNSDDTPGHHWKIVSYSGWSALPVKLHLMFLCGLV